MPTNGAAGGGIAGLPRGKVLFRVGVVWVSVTAVIDTV